MAIIKEAESIDDLNRLKHDYIQTVAAPLDGMWLDGFLPKSRHFEIYIDGKRIGYFCVNQDNYLLQFHIVSESLADSSSLFDSVNHCELLNGTIAGAFVSTAEPAYLSLCLDFYSNFEVNALMYEHSADTQLDATEPDPNSIEPLIPVTESQLGTAIKFANEAIGAPEDWLNEYYTTRISKNELYGVWENGCLIAAGEARRSEHQMGIADVGMIVGKSRRGKGVATRLLRKLVAINNSNHLKSICSTEKGNVAAQKAIQRAGFRAENRIIRFQN